MLLETKQHFNKFANIFFERLQEFTQEKIAFQTQRQIFSKLLKFDTQVDCLNALPLEIDETYQYDFKNIATMEQFKLYGVDAKHIENLVKLTYGDFVNTISKWDIPAFNEIAKTQMFKPSFEIMVIMSLANGTLIDDVEKCFKLGAKPEWLIIPLYKNVHRFPLETIKQLSKLYDQYYGNKLLNLTSKGTMEEKAYRQAILELCFSIVEYKQAYKLKALLGMQYTIQQEVVSEFITNERLRTLGMPDELVDAFKTLNEECQNHVYGEVIDALRLNLNMNSEDWLNSAVKTYQYYSATNAAKSHPITKEALLKKLGVLNSLLEVRTHEFFKYLKVLNLNT